MLAVSLWFPIKVEPSWFTTARFITTENCDLNSKPLVKYLQGILILKFFWPFSLEKVHVVSSV